MQQSRHVLTAVAVLLFLPQLLLPPMLLLFVNVYFCCVIVRAGCALHFAARRADGGAPAA